MSTFIDDSMFPKMGQGNDSQCMRKYLERVDPNGMISDIIWENELNSDRLGLHKFAPIQSNLLEFDPARMSDYRMVVAQCRRGLPQ